MSAFIRAGESTVETIKKMGEPKGERPDTVLESLDEDRRRTASYRYFYDLIESGELIDKAEFQGRLAPRFLYSDSSRVVCLVNNRNEWILDASGLRIPQRDVVTNRGIKERSQIDALELLISEKKNADKTEVQATATNASLQYFFNGVQSRLFSSAAELQGRLAPRFLYSDSSRVFGLVNSRDEWILDANGLRIPERDVVTTRKIEDRAIANDLSSIVEQLSLHDTILETYKKRISSNEYYRKLSYSGDVGSIAELQGRLAPRFLYSDSSRVACLVNDRNEWILDASGLRIPQRDVITNFKVDTNQRQVIEEIFSLTQGETTPLLVKNNLQTYFQTQDPTVLIRLREAIAANDIDINFQERIDTLLAEIEKEDRCNELQRRFYETIRQPGMAAVASAILTAYEQRSLEDTALVEELRKQVIIRRRLDICVEFSAALNIAKLDTEFSTVLAILLPLATSPIEVDRLAAQGLTEQLYQYEVSLYRLEVTKRLTQDADPREVFIYINNLPVRATVDKINYIEEYQQMRDVTLRILTQSQRVNRLDRANTIRGTFVSGQPNEILTAIESLPSETDQEQAIQRELFILYREYVSANRPEIFDEIFKSDIARQLVQEMRDRFVSPELGKNFKAFRYLRENFRKTVFRLGETFRDDPRTKEEMDRILRSGKEGENKVLRYVQRLTALEKQRPLTDIERAYIQSVELLSLFSPYLVAVASADKGATQAFLDHHFTQLSKETTEKLEDGTYVPLIQVGTGPNGANAIGEIVRNNAALADQTLVIDDGESPGGPFAIPGGAAWELNSANRRGQPSVSAPVAPGTDEIRTVRAYGNPVARWYPGERAPGETIRQGSINTTVDYLLTPDDVSTGRYPSNEELELVIALQAALLVRKIALKTRLLSVEPNPDYPNTPGDKIVTLEIATGTSESRTVRIRTDAILTGTGLGDKSYGFPLEGSRAERILSDTKNTRKFPKLSTTLEAFKGLADRGRDKKSPGKTLVIYGRGNSADTLIEFIGNIFQGDNPLVRDVTKIYLVADGDLSSRPRYALISDLKPRNGRGNLIEQVRARVNDVDFATSEGDPDTRQLVLLDERNQPIKNSSGDIITADSAIAATGFRSALDKIFAPLTNGKLFRGTAKDKATKPLVLPTNPDIQVADTLVDDPNVLFFGTASNPGFESVAKLAQLPVAAREALLRNGAENAVAVGFRGPDTQAAVNIWLNTCNIVLPEKEEVDAILLMEPSGPVQPGTEQRISNVIAKNDKRIPNNVRAETLVLSPILAYEVGKRLQINTDALSDPDKTVSYDFQVTYDSDREEFLLRYTGGSVRGAPTELLSMIDNVFYTEDVQRYTLSALRKQRRDPKLQLRIAFTRGEIDARNTFVQ